jgi:hypothetical protein
MGILESIGKVEPIDIGIPNGPAAYGTRDLLKAHDPKFVKLRSPAKR